MTESLTLLVWAASIGILCWMTRTLIKHVEDCRTSAASSHVLVVLERERCERIREECRELRGECNVAAAAAHEAMSDAEMFAESVDPGDDSDDPDDDDEPYRPGY